MKKYTDVFKKWLFWLLVAIMSLIQMVQFEQIFGGVSNTEALGILIGSFIFILLGHTVVYNIVKVIKKLKR